MNAGQLTIPLRLQTMEQTKTRNETRAQGSAFSLSKVYGTRKQEIYNHKILTNNRFLMKTGLPKE